MHLIPTDSSVLLITLMQTLDHDTISCQRKEATSAQSCSTGDSFCDLPVWVFAQPGSQDKPVILVGRASS